MPTISEMTYGFDAAGLETYLASLKKSVDSAVEKILDVEDIKTTCDNEWEGQAKENFLTNLGTDAAHVSAQLQAIYNMTKKEITDVAASMAHMDTNLISSGGE